MSSSSSNNIPQEGDDTTVGLWFSLHPAPNRKGETWPPLESQYIRVKNENMKVLTVKKYLALKYGLASEAEIDLSCMGWPLANSETLKYVRDIVWRGGPIESLTESAAANTPNENATSFVMPLHYAKHIAD